jgi:hypothetical protein
MSCERKLCPTESFPYLRHEDIEGDRALDRVRGQLYDPANLPPEEQPPVPTEQEAE